jgi:hypothetical protein
MCEAAVPVPGKRIERIVQGAEFSNERQRTGLRRRKTASRRFKCLRLSCTRSFGSLPRIISSRFTAGLRFAKRMAGRRFVSSASSADP